MTSKNSSSVNALRFQKLLFRRRLWPLAVTALIFFIYYVLTPTLALTGLERGDPETWDIETGLDHLQTAALSIFGFEGRYFCLVIATSLAVMLAVQGFAWLDSRRELDFYESQPVSGSMRFWGTVLNSVILFAGISLVMLLIGLLITAGCGAMSSLLLSQVWKQYFRTLCLFLAVYGISSLAAVLTGNVIFALLGTGVLLYAEAMFRYLSAGYLSIFFVTYDRNPLEGDFWFSPLIRYGTDTASRSRSILPNLILAVIALALAFWAFRIRKREQAGCAVVFAPVRFAVKAWLVLFFGLAAGMLGFTINGSDDITAAVILLLFFTVLTCCIMEIIYSMSIRDMFRHPLQIAAYCAIVLVIFLGFRFDVLGFDRRVPDASQVKSCAIVSRYGASEYGASSFTIPGQEEPGYDAKTYVEKTMELTDVGAVCDLAKAGIEETVAAGQDTQNETDWVDLSVLFRYNSGREEWRVFHVDADTDADLIDRVISSDDYKNTRFFLEDPVMSAHASETKIRWQSSWEASKEVYGYEDFLSAYKKDLENFHFRTVRTVPMIGSVSAAYTPDPNKTNYYHEYPVYADFENTIRWLTSAGIYNGDKPDLSKITRITVGLDAADLESPEPVEYTDAESIREIYDSLVFASSTTWAAWTGEPEGQYWVDAEFKGGEYNNGSAGAYFPTGKVPEFVREDLRLN